jgi:hypothetical protein
VAPIAREEIHVIAMFVYSTSNIALVSYLLLPSLSFTAIAILLNVYRSLLRTVVVTYGTEHTIIITRTSSQQPGAVGSMPSQLRTSGSPAAPVL